ncbi:hypothetical protein CLHUN_01800 [Ruminiclostridium hungatei]|uniref:DUF1540 domain-containing protein n=1 Tax=Ruminiclostridium hungatei TaxID=48256 RepID=A0A1V4SR84_RUMHU|nr:hypothetical protein [Ruminiclostridium hungatei]OPX46364.1 hypothetical protein CLHUN_01800 [Ruminiclostridium hungatei]
MSEPEEKCCYICENYIAFHGTAGTCKIKPKAILVDALDICQDFKEYGRKQIPGKEEANHESTTN